MHAHKKSAVSVNILFCSRAYKERLELHVRKASVVYQVCSVTTTCSHYGVNVHVHVCCRVTKMSQQKLDLLASISSMYDCHLQNLG